jgi:hypothetical protein
MTRREVGGARAVAAVLGVCVGASGLEHGYFEALQGNVPTPALFVQAIGPAQRMWVHGTEDAFTLVPNFLVTGMLAMVVGTAIIVWSIGFIDRPQGSRVLLALGGLLFLVGGGVAMLVLLAIGWAMARRIRRPLGPSRIVPAGAVRILSGAWPALVGIGLVLYAVALEIAIVGFLPAVSDPDQVLVICWVALVGMLLAFLGAFVGASSPNAEETTGRIAGGAPGARAV